MHNHPHRQENSPEAPTEFRKSTLSAPSAYIAIPTDYPRAVTWDCERAFVDFSFVWGPAGRKPESDIVPKAVLLAAWAILLSRLSGQYEVIVGTTIPSRSEKADGSEPSSRLRPIHLSLSGNPLVTELIEQTEARLREVRKNSDLALVPMLERFGAIPDAPHHPSFQALLVMDHDEGEFSDIPCELVLSLRNADDGITGRLFYARALFRHDSMIRLIDNYRVVLEAMMTNETECIMSLPIMTGAERRLVVETWNATEIEVPDERGIHQRFEEQAARDPKALAVALDEDSLSYGELNVRANRLAHRLRALGVRADRPVALCMTRGIEMIVGILAVLKAGGCYLPLDPEHPEERLRFMLDDSTSPVLLTKDAQAYPWASGIPCLDLSADFSGEPSTNPPPLETGPISGRLAYVIYTSGSTGMPKAVMVEHGNISNLLSDWATRFGDGRRQRMSMWTHVGFDVSVFEIFIALSSGSSLFLVPEAIRADPPALLAWFVHNRIDCAYLPPFFVRQLKGLLKDASLVLPFKQILVGVEPLSEADLYWLQCATPGLAIVNAYGPTETTVFCTAYQEITDQRRNAPIGRPVANTRIYILDDHGQPVPVGVPGELHVGGAGVARGYWNRPELSAERFIADPFSTRPGARLYRTGDRGRWLPDGNIEFLGRNDFQVKIRGFRIELGEIETVLAGYPGIIDVAVLAREDSPGLTRLVAYYTGAGSLDIAALRRYLADRMPEYMLPAAFVRLDRLPLSRNGKLDRGRLPAPKHGDFAGRQYQPPRNPLEATIAAIWSEMLGLERVGRQDRFLELGGNSLLTIQVISRLRALLNVDVSLRALLTGATLAEFAEAVAVSRPSRRPSISRHEQAGKGTPSFAQQRLWFLARVKNASQAYHLPFGWQLHGPLDTVVLRRALDRIVERHESLRTHFDEVDGNPVQRIATPAAMPLIEQDASSPEELRRLIDEEATQAFDLEQGPLIRGRLIRSCPDRHHLLITLHHIIADGWSMRVFLRELNTLYTAFLADQDDPLPPLALQYADYAAWQHTWIAGDFLRAEADYWAGVLSGAPACLNLPLARPRPAEQDFTGAQIDFVLDDAQARALHNLGLDLGTTPFVIFLAGWAMLLSRLSGQRDIVVGTPTANRASADIEDLIGFFVNTLALRVELVDDPSVAELLARVRERTLAAQEHQDIPFEQVVERVNPERSRAYSPLFQVMFVWEDDEGPRLELPGLDAITPVQATHRSAQFDLILTMRKTATGIAGKLEYATALFEPHSAAQMIDHYRTLLTGMAADPARRVRDIPMISGTERARLLCFGTGSRLNAEAGCIHTLFEEQARATPEAMAVVYQDDALTYAELNARANRLAHHLRALGVGPERRVAIVMERGLDMVVAALATLKAGGAYVPLDPAAPGERLGRLLDDCSPLALLIAGPVPETLTASAERFPIVDVCQPLRSYPASDPDTAEIGVQARHLAYVIYTSGSTGQPKGVMVEHRHLLASTRARHAAYGNVGRFLLLSPLYFDSSVAGLFGALTQGATLVVADLAAIRDPSRLDALLDRQNIDTLLCVPSLYGNYLAFSEPGNRQRRLSRVIVAGEACPPSLVAKSAAREPQVRLYNEYGPTEATVWATMHACSDADTGASVPIGRPIVGARVYILDDREEPVPQGVAGQIHIGGAGVTRGYLNRPELTAERFVIDPFEAEAGARMYRTGDLGRWLPDGSIEFLGRNDFQVKIRGFRIELGEIEAALLTHPEIREAAVIARKDATGEPVLVAYLEADDICEAETLRNHLAGRLPDYMLPMAYVVMPALPRTRNGKLDRQALPAPAATAYASGGYEAPEGALENAVAALWASLLKRERVGRRDSFFALGGHSLLVVQMVSRLRATLAVEIPFDALFAAPVLADFAVRVAQAAPARQPAMTKTPRPERLPLSLAQRGLWFLAQMGGASAAYNIPYELRLRGRLDKAALQRALTAIATRHESLRTRFTVLDGEPMPCIEPVEAIHVPLPETDASSPEELAELAQREEATPFDLQQAPLIRARLVREAEACHTLLVTMHHLVSDGWSMGVFARELSALYTAFATGSPDPLPPLDVQYADYVLWQQTQLSGERLAIQSAYWQATLAGAPELLTLPTDRPRPTEPDYAGATRTLTLDDDLAQALRALSVRHGTTLFMTLLAAWSVLLARFSGQDDIVVGTPSANRGRTEIEGLIGFFVNTLALRIDLSDDPTMTELLARVKRRTLEAQDHQDIPFEQVVERINPTRSLAYNPLFQVMFVWDRDGDSELAFSGLQPEPRRQTDYRVSKFDLTLTVKESAAGIDASFEYATALFDDATIARLAEAYRVLLRAMAANDAMAVSRLPLLSDDERRRVIHDLNATDAPFPADRCIHHWFEAQVERVPYAPAVECAGASLSYADLNRVANRVAHRLLALGVKPDDRVAICVERGIAMAVAVLAVLKAGGAYVPLDPNYPEERLRDIVEDCAPVILLSNGSGPDIAGSVPVVDIASAHACPETNPSAAAIGLSSAHLAYVIYTSGSTGKPKGAMIEHRNASNLAASQSAAFQPGPGSRVLQFASFSFDACVFEMLLAFCHGATLVIPANQEPLAGEDLVRTLDATGITHTLLPPAVLAAIPSGESLASVRYLVSGGDVVSEDIVRRFARGRHLFNAYGPTEITVAATLHACDADVSGAPPIGRPLPNTRIYILDAEGEPVPVGVAGELHIGGAGVARGYLNRPALSAERFLDDPFATAPGARMYKTGDLGRWRGDGSIDFLGRNDFQVKIRGFRIELGEIEARLRQCPGIDEAAVLAREDVPGDKRLVAYCVGTDCPLAETLRRYLSDRLPAYMVPVAFVRMERLPLTPNGKLDRKALPAPEGSAYASRDYEAPQGEFETLLAGIWSELLNVGAIGRQDDFFQLGGHSLLTVKLISRLRERLGIEVPLGIIFTRRTLAEFARFLSEAVPTRLPAISQAERGGLVPASFAQRRLWFLAQMDGATTAYHIPYGLRLRGALDIQALRAALDRILVRHEALRTRFVLIDGEPQQQIIPADDSRFPLVETCANDAAIATSLAKAEVVAPFDLEHDPLVRGLLIREAEDLHTLHITLHHIVSDGWSMSVFASELEALYGAYVQGGQDPLTPLPLQYADYALWQRRWLTGEHLETQASYWKTALAGAPELITLPCDHARPPEQDYTGDIVPLAFDEPLTEALKSLGQHYGTTPYQTFLAGWAALLSRLAGQDDVVIGTPTANRGRTEIEGLIGFFVNTLALRIDTSGDPTVAEFLARVKACALSAQEHQDIPFEQVVERVNPSRSLAHSPLFQVVFSWESADALCPRLPRLETEALDGTHYRVAKFDLTLSLRETNGRIEGALEYATALFERETIERLAGYYRALLTGMAADPGRRLTSLPILADAERRLVTQTWNATETPFPMDSCLHQLFETQAERRPETPAAVFQGRTLTYAELNRRANRLAHRLGALGVGPDDRVAICMERGLEMLIGLLAILKAGGAYVAMDPSYPAARLRHILADSAPAVLLTLGTPPESLDDALHAGLPIVDLARGLDDPASADLPDTNPDSARLGLESRHLAYVIYTSGSTGTPKGVMIEHRSAVNLVTGWLRRFEDFGRAESLHAALWTSFSFDVSVFELFTPLAAGGTVHVVPDDIRGEPGRLFDWYQENRITCAYLPPFFVRQLSDLMATSDAELPFDYLLVGVEPLLESQLHHIQTSRPGAGIHIVNGYGPTETTVFSTTYGQMHDRHRNAPIGRPVDNTRTYILDAHRQPVPVGVAGELYIGGAGLARGYLNLPELSAERFLDDPFAPNPGARMYKTGDRARWLSDGNIEFLGRNDHQVKLRGFRIELGEIETKLLEHPGIREVVVVARDDAAGEKALVAYYVGAEAFTAETLRTHLGSRLPKYMVPAAFVWMEALPLLPSGKLDQRALPIPDFTPQRSGVDFVAPRDETEARIAAIWSEILGIPDIGIDDNFFDLGGESFKAFRVVGRIGGGIGVTELFKYPSVRQLAERVSGGRSNSGDLLHELTRPVPSSEKTFTLVCIPFPAGGPISYQALAKAMPRNCTVLGLEMPGHDFGRREEQPLAIEELARRCAEEIARKVKGPIAIYGHCAGGALTIALAAELEARKIDITRLFIGGHFPTPHLPGKLFAFLRKVLPIHKWASQRSAFDILKSFGFFDEITDTAQRDFVMDNFVREHQEIEDYYTELFATPYRRLKTPLTCVIGEMDRATELYQERHREWAYFCESVDVAIIPKAGHYFIKHQPDELAELIVDAVGRAAEDPVDSLRPVPPTAEDAMENPLHVVPAVSEEPARRPSLATFFTVAIGEIISVIGSTLTSFALGVWVYQQTLLVSSYATMMIFVILPAIALAPVAGTLADRIDRKTIMIASNSLAGISTMAAALLIWTDSLQIWEVYVLAGLTAIANAFRLPAYAAMITQIVPKRYYGKANGFVQIGTGMGTFIGPALAGALMGLIGLKGIVISDFVSFLVAISTLLYVRFPNSLFGRREEPFLKEMIGGWNYIIKRHSLVAMIILVTVANYFVGLIEALITPLVLDSGNAESLGVVMAANGAGILVGSALMSLWGGTERRIHGILASTLCCGLSIAFAGATTSMALQSTGMFGFGFALALVNAHWISTVQTKVGMELQGRVMATNFMLMEAMVPLGYLSAGPLADRVFGPLLSEGGEWAPLLGHLFGTGPGRGIALIIVLSGGFIALLALLGYAYRPIRDLEAILPDARADAVIEAEKDKLQEKADLALASAA